VEVVLDKLFQTSYDVVVNFYRTVPEGGILPIGGKWMPTQRPNGRIHKYARNRTHLCKGVVIVLFLSACGQTGEIGTHQPGQASAQTQSEDAYQQTGQQPEGQKFRYAQGEVLVKFSPATEAHTIARIQKALKLETIRKFASPNLFLMKITDDTTVEKTIERLNGYESVTFAEPNYEVRISQ
jgi:hypothetical protein